MRFLSRNVDALRSLLPPLGFALACGMWVGLIVGAMLLVRDDRLIAGVALGATLLFAVVPPLRRRFRYFALVAGSLGVFLLFAEAMIRWNTFGGDALAHPDRYTPVGAMSDPDYLEPAPEPGVVYTLRPGFDGWVKGVRVLVNAAGLRDVEWSVGRPPERIRILALGTSITMAEGVSAERGFVARLGDRLRQQGFDIETMNFGVGGYNLGAAQALLRARGLRYRPDVVVQELAVAAAGETASSTGDLARAFAATRAAPERISVFERNSFALFAIYPPISLRARLANVIGAPVSAQGGPDGFVGRTLAEFGALARRETFTGVIFVPRPIHSLEIVDLDAPARGRIRDDAASAGLMYVDSYAEFRPSDDVEALSIYPAELHPNAMAHDRHARALARALEPLLASRGSDRSAVLQ